MKKCDLLLKRQYRCDINLSLPYPPYHVCGSAVANVVASLMNRGLLSKVIIVIRIFNIVNRYSEKVFSFTTSPLYAASEAAGLGDMVLRFDSLTG